MNTSLFWKQLAYILLS